MLLAMGRRRRRLYVSATSPSGQFQAAALAPFGVQVRGDLAKGLSADDGCWLATLLDQHSLIVAEEQALSLDQQLSLLESFGPVLGRGQDLAYVDAAEGTLNSEPLAFHSDMAFTRSPYIALSLHAVEVAPGESCTRFANGALAYERLTEAQRSRLDGLTAVWVSSQANQRILPDADSRFQYARAPVMRHPRTCKSILYVNEAQTARFNELGRDESIALLDELFDVLYAPMAVYQHDWKQADIVIWDNIALQHGRPPLGRVTRRRLQRVSVATESLIDMHPDFAVDRA